MRSRWSLLPGFVRFPRATGSSPVPEGPPRASGDHASLVGWTRYPDLREPSLRSKGPGHDVALLHGAAMGSVSREAP
jgi:hypothetical protein